PHARKGHALRASCGVVGDGERPRAVAAARGCEGYADGARGPGRNTRTARVGLGKVGGVRARDGDARNHQAGVAVLVSLTLWAELAVPAISAPSPRLLTD